ncbi:hypothetical protein [Shinella zoogloeoides]|uniref:hypothetical protein n=1 Tax=Shinella zoogloeoides TaxID=352475 RepID=UPI0028AD4D2D|nr:hypothetical protein [Shinella zoogloeoides]
MTAKTAKAPKPRKQPRPTLEEHPRVDGKDLVSLAAHDFLHELSLHIWETVDDRLQDGIENEVAWWFEHNLDNVESGEVEVEDFPYEDIDPEAVADRVKAHIAGWNATDVTFYNTTTPDGWKWRPEKD